MGISNLKKKVNLRFPFLAKFIFKKERDFIDSTGLLVDDISSIYKLDDLTLPLLI